MRIAVFADVQNAFYAARHAFDGKLNYGKMLSDIKGNREIIRSIAYMTKRADIDQSKFCEALTNMGYDVRYRDAKPRTKEGKTSFVSVSYEVMLTIDAVVLAEKVDTVVIITGDGAYLPLIEYLKSRGCRVELIGFRDSTSHDLIKAADKYDTVPKEWVFAQKKETVVEGDIVDGDDLDDLDEDSSYEKQPQVAGQPTAFGMFDE